MQAIKAGLRFVLMLPALFFSDASRSKDTLQGLMQSMQSDTAVRIAYQETRKLELLDQPWRGSGYMYSVPPDLMIKEQLQPERILMGVKGDLTYYFDPVNKVRRQSEMDMSSPLSLNLAVFKALINADEALLYRLYRVDFSAQKQGWVMTLKPKQSSESGFSIVISGPSGQQADRIEVTQPDGDFSVFSLRRDAAGKPIEAEVHRLYNELLGK